MATTKIWPVYHNYTNVIEYVINEQKTTVLRDDASALNAVISYALHGDKTDGQRLVSGVNCSADTAYIEMMQTKERFHKMGGRTGYHGYQSFEPGEVTPEQAHSIGIQMAQEAWGDTYQVVVTTHIDHAHIHNHFVLNSVSFVDGRKMRDSFFDYYETMRGTSDRLCAQNDLSVIENPTGKGRSHAQWRESKYGAGTLRDLIRADVDEAIANAQTIQQFVRNLKGIGYDVDTRRAHWRVKPQGKDRYVRLRSLGDTYLPEAIEQRLGWLQPDGAKSARSPTPTQEKRSPQRQYRVVRFAYPKPLRRPNTLRGLYYQYLKLLRFYTKRPPKHRKPFLIREEQRKLDSYIAQMELLRREEIDTPDQLAAFRSASEMSLSALTEERRQIYNKRRITKDEQIRQELTHEAAALSAGLKQLRQAQKCCVGIEEAALRIAHVLCVVRAEEHERHQVDVGVHDEHEGKNTR